MHRFALYSDIHGNLAALDAVLADIQARGIDRRYCLGDLVGYGPDPAGVIARVRELGDPVIRGNYDDGVGFRRGGCGCYYGTPEAREDGEASYTWTEAALSDADHEWLAALPDQLRLDLDGVRVLMCHGSPRKINEYLLPDRTDGFLAQLAEGAQADVLCVGHVHIPYHRTVRTATGRTAHWISDGSVGKPKDGDSRAAWVEVVIGSAEQVDRSLPADITAECAGGAWKPGRETRPPHDFECAGGAWVGTMIHRVDYDAEAVGRAMIAAGLPSRLAEALRRA